MKNGRFLAFRENGCVVGNGRTTVFFGELVVPPLKPLLLRREDGAISLTSMLPPT
jgi:hypothetical protein